jgi:hypothetical protein
MKKIALLCLALVLALGAMGVGYAMWYEDLYIDGTVYTGEVYAYWDFCGCFDIESKDVGTTSCQIDQADPRILHVTVDNGYPYYFGDCEVEFCIGGTVPVHFESIEFVPINFTMASARGADDGELWIDLVDGVGSQMHPGDCTALSFKVEVQQCALQNTDPDYPPGGYTFDIICKVVQYNESIYP